MLTPVPFYFLRHGETDWNARGVMQGQTDIPLNANGIRQAEALASIVAGLAITSVCSSSLQRAYRTAEIVTAGLKKPISRIDDLRECRFGIYEGQASNGPWREAWVNGGDLPGGEKHEAYIYRALKGLNQALSNPGPVLVVAHGGTFWAVQRYALKGETVRIPNCVLFRLDPPKTPNEIWTVSEVAAPEGRQLAIGEGALQVC